MKRILGLQDVEAAIRGGSVFAAGGGGWVEHGRMLGTAAVTIGEPELVSMDEVPDDAFIATAAAIGAPAGTTEWQMLGADYVKAVEILQDALGKPIYGLMIGQNGMSSTMNAWLPSALLGTKVVDAVGDIRAHPTGDMGSIGMASSSEPTIQTAVGGHRASHSYIELVARGATAKISPILRKAADMSGGFIASCRNPVPASYVKRHAALGESARPRSRPCHHGGRGKGRPGSDRHDLPDYFGVILGTGKVTRKAVTYADSAFEGVELGVEPTTYTGQ